MVLAMTHEEAVTYHVAREVRSYRDLPLMLFQSRPRSATSRGRGQGCCARASSR